MYYGDILPHILKYSIVYVWHYLETFLVCTWYHEMKRDDQDFYSQKR